MTRDCLLPILAPLAAARAAGRTLAELVAGLPPRFTATDRLEGVEPEAARALLARLEPDAALVLSAAGLPPEQARDRTDGLRLTLEGGAVLHLRPSGNAPEFRLYVEAASPDAAGAVLTRAVAAVRKLLAG